MKNIIPILKPGTKTVII